MEDQNGPQNYQQNQPVATVGKFFEQYLQQIAHTNTTINRFLSAFIDHVRFFDGILKEFFHFWILKYFSKKGLKDLDYIIQEKSILEYVFDFEFDSNVTESEKNSNLMLHLKFSMIK